MSSATPNSAAKRPAGGGGTRLDEETFETLRDVLTSVALDSTPRSSTRGAIVRNTPAATPNNHSSDNPHHSQGGGGSSTAWSALEDDETDGEEERILRRTVGIDSPSRRHATVSAIQEQLAPLGIFPLELSMGVVCVPRGLPPPSDERSATQQLTRRRVAKLEIVLATVGMKVAAQWYDPTPPPPANPAASAKMSSSSTTAPSYYPAVIRSFSGFYEGLSNLPDDSLSHFADFSVVEELSQRLPFLVAAVVVFDGDDVMSQAEAPVPTTGSTVTSSQVRRGVPLRLVWGQWGPSTTEGSRSSMAATTPTRSTTASSSSANQRSLTLFSPSNAIRTMRTPQPVTPSSHFTGSELMQLRPEELPQVLPLLSTITATTSSSVAVDSTPSLRTVVMMGPAGLSPAPAGGASAADKYPITAADWVTRHVYRSRRFSIFTISEETELDARQEALRDLLFRWRRLRASCAVPPPAVPLTEALLKEQQEQEELHRQQQLLQQQRNNHSALPKPRVAALDASLSQSVDSPRSSVGQAQTSSNNYNTPQQPRNGDALRSPTNNNDSRGRPSTARTLLTLEGIDQLPTAAALPKQQPTPQQQSEGSNEKNHVPMDPNKSSSPRQPKVVASPFVVKQTPLSAERDDDEEPHPSFRGAEQPPQQQQQQHSRAATKNVAIPSEERDDLGSRPHDVVATRHRAISEETVDVSSGPPCLQGHRAMGNPRNGAGRHVAPAPLLQHADPSPALPQQRVATPGISRPSSSLPGPQHPVAQPVDKRTLTNRRSEPSTAHDRNHLDLASSSSVALRKQEQHPQQARHQQHHQHLQVPSNTAAATSSLSEPALRMADPGGAVSQRPGSSSSRPLLRNDMAAATASGPPSSSTVAPGRGPSSHQPESSAPLLYAAPPSLRELQKPHPQPHHPQQRAAPMGVEEEDDAVVSEDSDDVKSHDTILESRSVSASRRDETHKGEEEEEEEEDVRGAMVSEAASPERYRQPVLRPHAYGGAAFARGTPTTTTAPTAAASRRDNDTLSPAPGPRQEGPPKPTASTSSQSSSVVKRTVYAQIHSQRSTTTHSTAPVARKGRAEEDWKPEGPKHAAGSDAHPQQHHPNDRPHESSVPRTAIALDYHYHRLVDASKYFGVDVPKARSSTTAKGTPPPPSRSSQSSSSKQKVPSSKNIAAMALLQKRKEGAGAASTSRRPTTADSSVRSSRPQSPYALMVDIPTPTSSQQAAITHRPQDGRRPAGDAAVSQHPNHHHHHPAAHRSPPQSQSSYDFAAAPPAQEVSMTSSAAAVYRPEPMRTLFRDRVESGRSRSPFEADDPSLRREVRISPLLQRKQQVIEDAAYVGKNAGPQRRSASPTQSSPQQSLASAPRANERRNSGSGPASSMPRTGSSSRAPIQRENSGGIIGLFDTPRPQSQYGVDRRRPVQQYAPQQQYIDPAAFDMPTLRTHPIQS